MLIKLLYFVLFCLSQSIAQDTAKVIFLVEAENVPENSVIYITGNAPALGRWAPDVQAMEFIAGRWQKILHFPQGVTLEYKFTRGSWQNEALNDDGSTPSNNSLNIVNDTTVVYKINLWKDQTSSGVVQNFSGQITGTVVYHKNFKSSEVKSRDIVVWLPPGYYENDFMHYPVLYLQDGQNAFDPEKSAFGVDWQIDEAADTLIRNGMIEPIIIVAIYNSIYRSSEYANNDTGYAYLKFIIDELKPFIDMNYRTRPDENNTAVIGSSLGGLISFILAWEHPDVFSKAACVSPAFKIDRYDYLTNLKNYSGEKKQIKIYIDNGGVGIEHKLQPGIDELLSMLEDFGFEREKDYYFFKDIDAEHGEKDWAKRVWRSLIFFFGKYPALEYLKNY